jgi:hypothetical protein
LKSSLRPLKNAFPGVNVQPRILEAKEIRKHNPAEKESRIESDRVPWVLIPKETSRGMIYEDERTKSQKGDLWERIKRSIVSHAVSDHLALCILLLSTSFQNSDR